MSFDPASTAAADRAGPSARHGRASFVPEGGTIGNVSLRRDSLQRRACRSGRRWWPISCSTRGAGADAEHRGSGRVLGGFDSHPFWTRQGVAGLRRPCPGPAAAPGPRSRALAPHPAEPARKLMTRLTRGMGKALHADAGRRRWAPAEGGRAWSRSRSASCCPSRRGLWPNRARRCVGVLPPSAPTEVFARPASRTACHAAGTLHSAAAWNARLEGLGATALSLRAGREAVCAAECTGDDPPKRAAVLLTRFFLVRTACSIGVASLPALSPSELVDREGVAPDHGLDRQPK